jgi:tetratricopeptide (TPR) repeat protein
MTEEMEKNFKDLEELYKLGMLDAEGYAFQKKQLEDEMARESGQATSTPSPIQQETTSPSLEAAAPPPLPEMPKIHVSVGGKEMGALEREEVIQKIRAGEIRRDARVWKKGMPDWVEAGNLPELEDYFGPPPDKTVTVSTSAEREEAQAALERGIKHHENKDYDQAIKEFNEAIRLNPKNAVAYAYRGDVYRMKSQNDLAIKEFNEAIRLDPKNVDAYSCRGDVYRMTGQYDQAISDCTEAIKLDPYNAFAYANRGEAYRKKERYDQAIKDFNEAIRFNPNNAMSYAGRGDAYMKVFVYDKAGSDSKIALRLNRNNELAKSVLQKIPWAYR